MGFADTDWTAPRRHRHWAWNLGADCIAWGRSRYRAVLEPPLQKPVIHELISIVRIASRISLKVNGCPHHSDANRSTKAFPYRRTNRAERVIPSSYSGWCSSEAVRAEARVHPVSVFALCIWQAPRPAATFGSFWSLQKEHAVGRESGERWMLNLKFDLDLA